MIQSPYKAPCQADFATFRPDAQHPHMPTVHVDLAERAYNVIIEPETLHTLGEREYHEGFAEAIKHAAIRDAAMLEELAAIDTNPISPISMGSVGLHPIEQFESISLESPR